MVFLANVLIGFALGLILLLGGSSIAILVEFLSDCRKASEEKLKGGE